MRYFCMSKLVEQLCSFLAFFNACSPFREQSREEAGKTTEQPSVVLPVFSSGLC